jgi:hypothetical protein
MRCNLAHRPINKVILSAVLADGNIMGHAAYKGYRGKNNARYHKICYTAELRAHNKISFMKLFC